MNVLLILGGLALIVGGWLSALVNDGWNAPEGKPQYKSWAAMAAGLACLIVGIVRSF